MFFHPVNDLKPHADDPFYPTQADMLECSHKKCDKIISRLNKIYDNIAKNFSEDKEFIQALRKNQELFFEYRKSERDIALPKLNNGIYYGSNRGIYSDFILKESTENQIKNLRNLIEDYCLYNHYEQDENACKPETLDKIFK